MIHDIKIINKNTIQINTTDKHDTEKFIKICTVLDPNKAAKSLFNTEVNIIYKEDNIIILQNSYDFNYTECENFLYHLQNYFTNMDSTKMALWLKQAWQMLDHNGLIFCEFNKSPQFNININRNHIIIKPMHPKFMNSQSEHTQELLNHLYNTPDLKTRLEDNYIINIYINNNIHQSITSIVNILIDQDIIEAKDNNQIISFLTSPSNNTEFCIFQNEKIFSIKTDRQNLLLKPLSKKYMDLHSTKTINLINAIEKLPDITILINSNYIIDISITNEIHHTIGSIVETFIKTNIINNSDKDIIFQQLIYLAFKDITTNELKTIQNIIQYPNYHPLSKYKNSAKNIENLLMQLINNKKLTHDESKTLKAALNHEGEFAALPQIIMRSFDKLDKNFHNELNTLINNTHNN